MSDSAEGKRAEPVPRPRESLLDPFRTERRGVRAGSRGPAFRRAAVHRETLRGNHVKDNVSRPRSSPEEDKRVSAVSSDSLHTYINCSVMDTAGSILLIGDSHTLSNDGQRLEHCKRVRKHIKRRCPYHPFLWVGGSSRCNGSTRLTSLDGVPARI